jgi:hypothetical protein
MSSTRIGNQVTPPLRIGGGGKEILFPTAPAIPATITSNGRTYGVLEVLIKCDGLEPLLKSYYGAGVRRVKLLTFAAGHQVVLSCSVVKKEDSRRKKVYYVLYPLGDGQRLLRDLYIAYRGEARRGAKRPMPIFVHAVMPVQDKE